MNQPTPIETLRSRAAGAFHQGDGGFVSLVDPSSEDVLALASTRGIDGEAMLDHARLRGGPALAELTFTERGEILRGLSKALREKREELLELSRRNNGTTTGDGAFDIDGASGALAFYGGLGKQLGDRRLLAEDEVVALSRGEGFAVRHLLVPRAGVAVHINAFNFPAWGFAEKAAQAWLAGMPVISKPATSTAAVAARALEIVHASGLLPEGALQWLCGSTGDLLDRLGPQDVVAFTGSAATAASLRDRPAIRAANVRFNVEADSLNAAVLGPDVEPGSPLFQLFLRDVAREMTQKSGQKCTAVRRILVPVAARAAAEAALVAALEQVVTGDPGVAGVGMGPLATAAQLEDAEAGVAELLRAGATLRCGAARRIDGVGAPRGRGFFFAPTLLAVDGDPRAAAAVHQREVFAPVATMLDYDGMAESAAAVVALGGGTLVVSAYSDDRAWLERFLRLAGPTTGRLYVGSTEAAAEAPGSGAAFPQALHGGPGRAGGGEELGGRAGLRLYQQRLAVQGAAGWLGTLGAGS